MKFDNYMILDIPSKSANEGFARSAVACFAAQLDPTLEELGDIRTAVSEAVTNAIVHAYRGKERREECKVYIRVICYRDRWVKIIVRDKGCGIPDVEAARVPLFTTDPENERSGMGFAVMENFSHRMSVWSKVDGGTRITLWKHLKD